MKPCDLMQQAVLDESLPRPDDFEPHLASCPECGEVASAHRAALRLRGETWSRTRLRPLPEVRRRVGIVAGLVLALGGGGGLLALQLDDRPGLAQQTPGRTQRELPVMAVEADDADFFALAQLQASVSADLRRDPRNDPVAVRVFGALPSWTAPTRTRPMRSLERSASPVVFTSEDSP
ncbi:MAG: hypothetical protein Q8N23_18290 [Archangium sp.]|nr:hypothetical protein [Archangium sp.]MDP3154634.1 hypothetical protein [Archangium sp.]MDP3572738.1 hypothetical protein [Archangium sp.]